LRVALYVMHHSKLSCTYVVSATGEPLGLVTLQDICKYIIQQDARQKALHSDLVHRENKVVRRLATFQ
jgi:CBS domain containing-hemolysin-like protein